MWTRPTHFNQMPFEPESCCADDASGTQGTKASASSGQLANLSSLKSTCSLSSLRKYVPSLGKKTPLLSSCNGKFINHLSPLLIPKIWRATFGWSQWWSLAFCTARSTLGGPNALLGVRPCGELQLHGARESSHKRRERRWRFERARNTVTLILDCFR